MKKLCALLMVVLMCFALCACGGNEPDESIEDRVRSEAEHTVYVDVYLEYGYYPTVNATYVREMGENKYSVSGKVRVNDKYGDQYTGTFDAIVQYHPEDDDLSTSSYEVSALYK